MTQIEKDIQFVKKCLPEHYAVQESKSAGSIHCKSPIGIRKGVDAEDEEHWGYVVSAISQYFGERFQEIDHNTNFCHVDFTVFVTNTWIKVETRLPTTSDYFKVEFDDGTEDEKPFRIRPSKNIMGFMTEGNVVAWKPIVD